MVMPRCLLKRELDDCWARKESAMVYPNLRHYRYSGRRARAGRMEMHGFLLAVALVLMLAVIVVYSILQ